MAANEPATPPSAEEPNEAQIAQQLAADTELRLVALAVDDRTIMGQTLATEANEQWIRLVDNLAAENLSLFRRTAAKAEADWLLQVAALERTDIVYLSPVAAEGTAVSDDSLRMSPPGKAAIAWLKAELESIARDANRPSADELEAKVLDLFSDPQAEPVKDETGEPITEPPAEAATAAPAPSEDSQLAKISEAQRQLELARQHYEQRRAEAAGAKAGSFLFHHGPAEDLKAQIVEEQSALYHTANRTQAVLGAYGTMVAGNRLLHRLARFEQRSIVAQLQRVRRFVTVEREGRGTGQDFVSLVGNRQAWEIVDLAAQIAAGRRREVAFEILGVRLDQNDVIKALNADRDALSYFEYLRQQNETPCFVLENIVFTSYAAASEVSLALGGKAKTILTADGFGAQTQNQRGSFTRFAAPIIRCYQPYEVKLAGGRVVDLSYLEP